MLYYLHHLSSLFIGFNVFRYITFRTAFATITAFLISVFFGRVIIRHLKRIGISEETRKSDSPKLSELHKSKDKTPTMGGIIILLAVIVSVVLWAQPTNFYVQIVALTVVWLGIVGFIDDYIKLTHPKAQGLAKKSKFIAQIVLGCLVGFLILRHVKSTNMPYGTDLVLPFIKMQKFTIPLAIFGGVFYVALAVLVLVGSSNAVNLTDGLDGLAIGCMIVVCITFAIVAYIVGNFKFSSHLLLPFVRGGGELAVFCGALAGAGLGFLWWNCHPAEVFMGDTGSLPLGGAIGVIAISLKQELLLFIVGGIFVAEAFSVILQVISFRRWGKRVFLCAPLHHHYQFKGWPETKVTVRFLIIAAILALFSIATLKIR